MLKRAMTYLMVLVFCVGTLSMGACGEKPFSLNQTSLEMEQYEEFTLQPNKEGEIKWESSDPRSVKVENGKLTSLKLGDAIITATLGKEVATCSVKVKASTKGRALSVDQDSVTVSNGEKVTVTAVLKENGTVIPADLTWISKNPKIASVENGVITGVKSGDTKVIVSVTYKGQVIEKEIAVKSINGKKRNVQFEAKNGTPAGALSQFEGDVTSLGFADRTVVTKWMTEQSQIFAKDVTKQEFDYLIFDFVVAEGNPNDVAVNNAGDIVEGAGVLNGLKSSSVLYYGNDGKVVKTLENNKVYTGVINLKNGKDDLTSSSISFKTKATVYLANSIACSSEYYQTFYSQFEMPPELITKGLYIARAEQAGQFAELSDKVTEDPYKDFYKVHYMTDIWGERIAVANEEMNGYVGVTAMHEIARRYDFYGYDIVFTSDVPDLYIWTGGYAIIVKGGVATTETGGTPLENDLVILKTSDGTDVTGSVLEKNVCYTFIIRIQKDNPLNAAFGLGTPGDVSNYFYIGNPFFF